MKKKVLRKQTMAILILVFAVLNIFMLAIQNVNAEEELSVHANPILEGTLEKYINYDISEGDKGTLVQYHLRTGIDYQEESEVFPVKENETTIQVGQIDGKYPYDVRVITNRTEVTNGNTDIYHTDMLYDPSTGTVTIYMDNLDENGNMLSDKIPNSDNRDDYIVVCYYDTYIDNPVERKVSLDISSKMTLFSNENTEVYGEGKLENVVTENVGDVTSIKHDTEDIYNGYIKSNIINGTEYNTPYTETAEINVSKKEVHQKMQITEENTFVRTNGEEVVRDLGNDYELVYKSTKFEKQNIVELLGEEFNIEISDENNNILATINQDTQFAEDGSITITYENDVKNVNIKTSKIITEGIFHIENTKEIKSTMREIQNVKIKTTTNIIGMNEEEVKIQTEENTEETQIVEKESYTKTDESFVEIKDAETKVDFDISTENLTNEKQNEITFKIKLQTTSNADNMFKNTKLKIELPNQVEKVILKENSIIYANGLTLSEPYIETNENGNINIVSTLEGTQTQYNENELGLTTNIEIKAVLILKKDIENASESINLNYTNEWTLDNEIESGNCSKKVEINSFQNTNVVKEDENLSGESIINTQDIEGLQLEVNPIRGNTNINDGDVIYEGEYIKYNIKVTNTSDEDINNLKIIGTIPDGLTYGELEADFNSFRGEYKYNFDDSIREKNIDIGTIKSGESKTVFYEVQANDLADVEEKQILTEIKVCLGEQEVQNYEIRNVVKKAEVKVFLRANLDYRGHNGWNYWVDLSSAVEEDVTVKIYLPKEFELDCVVYEGSKISLDMEISEENVITTTLNSTGSYSFQGAIDNIEKEDSKSSVELTAFVEVIKDNIYTSNENRIIVQYNNVNVSMTSPNEGEEVKYGEEINYEVKIENTGGNNVNYGESDYINVRLTDYLPEDLQPISITYNTWTLDDKLQIVSNDTITKDISGINVDESGKPLPNIDEYILIPSGETSTITIKTTAGYVYEETTVDNHVTVTGDEIDAKTSNTITHTILPNNPDQPNNPDNPNNPDDPDNPNNPDNPDNPDNPNNPDNPQNTYSISGIAWEDQNEDGQRQIDENGLNGITVMLIDMKNPNTVRTRVETDANGAYTFSDLEQGNYVVIFRYDTNTYRITEYQKSGVSNSLNSDGTSTTIILNGEQISVGVTDTIEIGSNVTNIDIGLIKNKICDFKLDKYINKITVVTNKGTKEQAYNNEKLAKVEIRAKEIEGATVIVEYKIVATNEGEMTANIEEIVDYIPEGFDFSSELNNDWAIKKSGEIMNTSTSNKEIAPGESVELKLVLTKQMTQNETGTFTNIAEISEISNSQGVKDIDSTPANRVNSEDDFSQADVIISISTGAIVYISIAIAILLILIIVCIVLIKKGKLDIHKILKFSKMTVFLILFTMTIVLQQTEVNAYQQSYYFVYDTSEGQYGHTFFGGPTGIAYCMNEGAQAYNTTYSYGGIASEKYANKIETSTGDFTLTNNKEDMIGMKKLGSDYILGPFYVTCSSNGTYNYYIYDGNGNQITTYTTCDSNGYPIDVSGSMGFYIKIPESQLQNGISRVKLSATRTVATTIQQDYYVIPWYSCPYPDGQDIQASGYVYDSTTSSQSSKDVTKSVEWTNFQGGLQIIKQDADDMNVKLPGVEINVRNDSLGYNQTFTTDENGEIYVDNLQPGEYIVTEVSNNHYGYTKIESEEVQIYAGAFRKYSLTNEKQTGNLKIEKKDTDNNNVLEGVSFRIKEQQSDQYVIGMQEDESGNLIPITTATGTVYFDNMKTTDNPDEATTFVTDENGLIQIHNILIGTYIVEEISVGDHNFGYETDDEYISWEINGETGSGNDMVVEVSRQRSYKTVEDTSIITDSKKIVEDGTYEIESGLNANVVVDIGHAYPYNGANVNIHQKNGSIAQKFYIKYLGDGYYSIISMATNKYVDVENASTTPGANVHTWDFNNLDAQRWLFQDAGNGYYYFISKCNSLYMDVKDALIADFTNVQVNRFTNSRAETFKLNDWYEVGEGDFSTVIVKNRRKYIKIRGFAWEEKTDGKNSTKDYTWNDETEDKRLANVPVRLMDANGQIMDETITDVNGEYVFGNYDENTEAIKLEIDDLVGAYIEFEYNGMSYQSIEVNPEFNPQEETTSNGNTIVRYSGNKNTATDEALRPEFNDNYATISKGMSSTTTGEAKYSIEYEYDAKYHKSGVIYGDENEIRYGYERQTYPISGTYDQYTLRAVTQRSTTNALCTPLTPEQIREEAVVEIGGLNLGVEERIMPDLAVVQDMDNVEIKLNGYTHTYQYAQRFENPEEYAGGDPFNVGVKFANKYISNSYSREVYSSDLVYNEQYEGGKLEVYVTYRVQLRNESSVYSQLKTLKNYYDERYESILVRDDGYVTNDKGIITEYGEEISSTVDSRYNKDGMKRADIYTDYKMAPGETREITITYKLNNDAINSILNGKVTLDSITEVTSYSSYSDDQYSIPYAGIDVDSAPDTIDPSNYINTTEDDTDKAPSLILIWKEERVITGTVWEDSADPMFLNNTDPYEKQRRGDGEYQQASENVIEKVQVELLIPEGSNLYRTAKLYQYDKGDKIITDAIVETDNYGNYEFVGVIPSSYILRYTYGNTSIFCDKDGNPLLDGEGNKIHVNVDNYKSTIYRGGSQENVETIKKNRYWYREETSNVEAVQRLSDARDTEGIKTNGTKIDIIADRIEDKDYYYGNLATEKELESICANTEIFDIKLDYDVELDNISQYGAELKFIFDNIDFGIIERPRQDLEVDKQISNIEITLANGTTLIKGDPRSQNLSGVRVLDNHDVYIEMDNELIQGSTMTVTYEISVDNRKCEIDYNDENYYIYGIVPTNKEQKYKIARVMDMYDYLPSELLLQTKYSGSWEKIAIRDTDKGTVLSEEAYEAVKGLQNIVHLGTRVFAYQEPGTILSDNTLVVSKQLSTTSDDLTYENDVEITRVIGRGVYNSTPGNYDPTTNTPDELDNAKVGITITAPTGENRQYILYGTLGISLLVIVGVGIVFIKKKVL